MSVFEGGRLLRHSKCGHCRALLVGASETVHSLESAEHLFLLLLLSVSDSSDMSSERCSERLVINDRQNDRESVSQASSSSLHSILNSADNAICRGQIKLAQCSE